MEVQLGPNPVEESVRNVLLAFLIYKIRLLTFTTYRHFQNLLYKLQRKVKVFKTCNSLSHRGYNLITTSSKYGLVFVASPQGVLSGKEYIIYYNL